MYSLRLSFIALLLLPASLRAQTAREWSLQECVSYALAHNLNIRQQEDNVQLQQIQLSTARNSRLPNLSGSAGESFSFGRALTADNTYANRNTQNTNLSLGTSVPLITGGQLVHEVGVQRLGLQAAIEDSERMRENVTLQVISAYLECAYQKDMVRVAADQVELSALQVRRMELLFQNQKASEADLAQIRSAHAADELTLTQQRNSLMLSLLELSQLLELEHPEGFDVVQPVGEPAEGVLLPSPDEVYAQALGIKPQIAAEQLRLQSARKSVLLARSQLYPSLYFNAGLGSSYYRTSGWQTTGFGRQLKDNFNQYFGFSLSVPIFNRLATRNNIRAARVRVHTQEIQLEQTRQALYKEIQQAYYNALASQRQCQSSQAALNAAQTAFDLTQRKYENGKANATEFQEAKTALLRAQSDDARARYTFLFRRKILHFYQTSGIEG
ncbi:MAG: TolC family protein [Bacteroidaceae bacterium]|nr:TolC family protein [Bacteroidaceae bacterium]